MSKIYEALLRAEIDRVDPPPVSSAVTGSVATAVSTTSVLASPQEAGNGTITADESLPGPDRRPVLPLDDVAFRPWSPVLERLPALQARGHAAEQFRSLRSRMYEYRGFESLKTVLISSGLPQEGKSFVAANLALSLARYKSSKVLLIDGDLRRASLHQLLGCSPEPGLADYLAGRVNALEILQRAEIGPEVNGLRPVLTNLAFIPGGKGGDSVFDLSGNKRFADLIAFVSPHFDWIVVDSSPVNLVADAVNLASSCDGVLLVARSGVTRYQTLQAAQGELKASKILGVVLNGAPEVSSNQGYYGYSTDGE